MKSNAFMLFVVFLSLMLLTACRYAEQQLSNDEPVNLSSEEQALLSSSEQIETPPPPRIVGTIPEKGIALYYVNTSEMILETENSKQVVPWHAHSNYGAQMASYDIDGDGTDEIIVNTVTWTGTGVYMQELHIVKVNEDGLFSFSTLTGDDCANLLNHRFTMTFDELHKIVDLYFDGEKYSIDVSDVNQRYKELDKEYEIDGLSHIDFSNWLVYDLKDNTVTISIDIGLYATNPHLPLPFVTIPFSAEVQYKNNEEAFQFTNCRINIPTSSM